VALKSWPGSQTLGSVRNRTSALPNYHNVWFARNVLDTNRDVSMELNGFGQDYFKVGGDWQRLCPLDSDGDGLSNGQELGDPCCVWRPGGSKDFSLQAQLEYRRWLVTHPGRKDQGTRIDQIPGPPECTGNYEAAAYARQFTTFYYSGLDLPKTTENLNPAKVACLCLIIILLADWVLFRGLCLDVAPFLCSKPLITSRTAWTTCVACYLYMDVTSSLVHIILDFAPSSLPGLGGVARGFQYHHFDPTAILRISWYEYASHIHLLSPLIAVLAYSFRASRVQRLFWFWGLIYAHLFQTAHRWAHLPKEQLPYIVLATQSWGLLLSHETHMHHHEDLDSQFSSFVGHCDLILDFLVRWVPAHRYDLWIFAGVGWLLLPFILDLRYRSTFEALEGRGKLKIDEEVPPQASHNLFLQVP